MQASATLQGRLITNKEAAAYMRCSTVFLWKMRKEGRLRSLSAGKKVLYEKSELDTFLNNKEGDNGK